MRRPCSRVLQRRKRNSIRRRKVMLRHSQGETDASYVRHLDPGHAQPAHLLASGVPCRLLKAFDQFFPKLAHGPCSLRLPGTQLFKIAASFRIAFFSSAVRPPAAPSHRPSANKAGGHSRDRNKYHPRAAALAASGARPSYLPHTASFGDHVPFLRIPGDKLYECLPLLVVPDVFRLADEKRVFLPRQ